MPLIHKEKKLLSKTRDENDFDDILGGKKVDESLPVFYYGPPPAIRLLQSNNKYDKDFHPLDFLAHLREGSTRSEVCAAWGITYSTLNKWIESYPEMAEAYAVGKPAYEAYYKRALKLAAFGQLKTVKENSLFFLLKNVAGFTDDGAHEFGDGEQAEIEFVDDNE